MEKVLKLSKSVLLEVRRRRSIIREIILDIIKVYKSEEEGEFYLPEYFDEENHAYYFEKLKNPFVIELTIFPDDEIDRFLIDADYFDEEGIIAITIVYDPEMKINLIYDIIGELNEIVTHELRHIDQHNNDMFDFDPEEMDAANEDSVSYYTQPHELDAQVYGFKRLAKLRKLPFEQVVRDWFKTHQDIHQMEKQDVEFVIDKILNYQNN